MFFIFFFHFSEEKVSSFLFSCISFKCVLLLASVSEFNKRCFLRSRCSMEMWCPDDIGRDWVGPPAWGRACFNSPEWGGGSSPVKTEPSRLDYCRCLGHDLMCVYGHSTPVTATVTETNLWQVTWESRLPATSPPPLPCETQEKTTLQQHRNSEQTARYKGHVEILSKFQSQARKPKHICAHFSIRRRQRAQRKSTSGAESTIM